MREVKDKNTGETDWTAGVTCIRYMTKIDSPLEILNTAVADPGFGQGGPTLKQEGCMPDFIEGCSLLGAKQCKMYILTLGLGEAQASGTPWICYCTDFVSYIKQMKDSYIYKKEKKILFKLETLHRLMLRER